MSFWKRSRRPRGQIDNNKNKKYSSSSLGSESEGRASSSSLGNKKHNNTPGASNLTVFRVTVPENIQPGGEFQVYAGPRIVRVRCPVNCRPGQSLQISVPIDNASNTSNTPSSNNANNTPSNNSNANNTATTPNASNSSPPTRRKHSTDGSNNSDNNDNDNNNSGRMTNGIGDSSSSAFQSMNNPQQQQQQQQNHNSSDVRQIADSDPPAYMVSIPENVTVGEQFLVIIRGQQLTVTCPMEAAPGMSVRIVPPRQEELDENGYGNGYGNGYDNANWNQDYNNNMYTDYEQQQQQLQQYRDEDVETGDVLSDLTENNYSSNEMQQLQLQRQQNQYQYQIQRQRERERKSNASQLFEVKVPMGVQPGAPFALLANGVRVLVTCPLDAGEGKKIRFRLPLALMEAQNAETSNRGSVNAQQNEMQAIRLKYDKDGWSRTVRIDMKFQWIRIDDKGDVDSTMTRRFHMEKSAYVRRLRFMQGDDPRIRSGLLDLVPATDSVVDSKIKSTDGRELLSYGDLARAQGKSFNDKTEWFQDTCAQLCVEWNEGHMRMNIRRQCLMDDSVNAVMSLSRKDLRKLWRFEFIGEPGIDAGGLAREWFELVCQEIFDPDMGLWISSATNQMSMTINPASGEYFSSGSSNMTMMMMMMMMICIVILYIVVGWFIYSLAHSLYSTTHSLTHPLLNLSTRTPTTTTTTTTEYCCDDHLVYYRFLGRIMGKAMFDRQLVKGHMVKHLYKHILGWPIYFKDLESIDEEYYNNLKQLQSMHERGEDISILCLDFTITTEMLGVKKEVELINDGANVDVTNDNFPEYVEACLKYKLMGSVKPQLNELLLGFFDVIPEPLMTIFDYQELELIMCGLPHINLDDWKNHTEYSGDYEDLGVHHPKVEWFWETLEEFDDEMRARLLLFVTGTSGVPSRGFGVLQSNDGNIRNFAIHGVSAEICFYPRAHTCFNRIDLPLYETKQDLQQRLKLAVTMSATGFDIE